jgi:hypothetical protein
VRRIFLPISRDILFVVGAGFDEGISCNASGLEEGRIDEAVWGDFECGAGSFACADFGEGFGGEWVPCFEV